LALLDLSELALDFGEEESPLADELADASLEDDPFELSLPPEAAAGVDALSDVSLLALFLLA
jgi:hypothetical protein